MGQKFSNSKLEEPVYAVDVYKNYEKYDNPESASKELGISKDKILKCAEGDIESVEGLIFIFAPDIEIKQKNTVKPDDFMLEMAADILQELQNPKKPFLGLDEILNLNKQKNGGKITKVCDFPDEVLTEKQKRYLRTPFYIMDEGGEYRKFYNPRPIEEALGVGCGRIKKCWNNRSYIEGFAIAKASEVERKVAKGVIFVDVEKLKTRFKEKEGFYAVDAKGNCKKFKKPKEASKELDIPYGSILKCCSKKQRKSGGYFFIKAKELEIKKPDGKIDINEQKILEIMKLLQKNAIYLIDEKKHKRYNDHIEAGEKLGIDHKQILKCVLGFSKTVHGYAATRAINVETIGRNREIFVDEKKLKELYLKSKQQTKNNISEKGFYSIDQNLVCKHFYTPEEAQKATGVKGSQITKCLRGEGYVTKGFIWALAEEIEFEKEDGTTDVDLEKVKEKAKIFERKAFYSIDKNRKCTYFLHEEDAEKALEIPRVSIAMCLCGGANTAYEHVFVRPEEIEIKDENGEIKLDEEVIENAVREITKDEVCVIDENAKWDIYADRTKVVKDIGVDRSSLCACLKGRAKTAKGRVYVHPWEVDARFENGEYFVNEEKVKEKAKILKKKK